MPTKTVVEQLIIEIAGDSKKFKATVKELKKGNKDISSSFKTLAKVGTASFAAVGAAAVTLGTVAVKAFAEFETGLTNVAKTTNLAGKDLDDFKNDIMKMSEEIPVTTDKLLEIATAAGQLGIKGTKNLSKFTETIAKLGATTDVEGNDAALAIARILNLTNESIDSVDKLGSTLVDLGNNFATSESEILEVSKDVAKATVQFGLASDEILGISAAMSSLGIAAEAGGTVVGKAFASIDSAIRDQTGPAFEKLMELTGMTGDQLTQTFATDASAVFTKFVEGLGRAGEEGKDMTAELGAMNLSGIRVNKILPTLASRSDLLADAMERAGIASKDASALNAEAAKAFETNASKWQIAQNKINNTFINLGEEIAPEVTEAITAISDAVADNKEAIALLASGISAAIRIIGGALSLAGKLISAVKKTVKLKTDLAKKNREEQKALIKSIKTTDSWVKAQKKADKENQKVTDNWAEQAKQKAATDEQYVDGWLIKEDERVQKAKESDDKIVQSTEDAADKRNAAIEAEAMERAEIQADADDEEFARIEEFSDEVVAEIEKREAEKHAAQMGYLVEADKLYAKHHKGVLLSETAFGKKMVMLKEIQATAEYGAIKDGAGALSGLINSENDNLKAIGKAATIVQIGMATAEGAMKAFTSLAWIPYVGPVLGGVAAAALVAYGGEQVAKVQGMQTGGIVPGTGSGDIVPAMLEPGELVVPKDVTREMMKRVDARKMAEGGVAGEEQATGMQKTFNDIFGIPGIFLSILGLEGGNSNKSVSGFGAEAFAGMPQMMMGELSEAANEMFKVFLTAIPGGEFLYKTLEAFGLTPDQINDMVESGAIGEILKKLGIADDVVNIVNTGFDTVVGLGGAAAGAWEGIKDVFGFSKGGFVPGSGSKDSVRAMLTPGELVIPKDFASSIGSISGGGVGSSSILGGSGGAGAGGIEKVIVGFDIGIQDDAVDFITVKQREKEILGT